MVAGAICGFPPGFEYFSVRELPTEAVISPGSFSSTPRFKASSGDDLSAQGLRQRFADLHGVPFHGEIQVADGRTAEHVAHSTARQPDVDARRGRELLDSPMTRF